MGSVIVHLPPDAGNGLQVAVNTDDDGHVEVLVRAASHHQWQKLDHIEGTFEVRS
jgi:hypothetical protein